ncbi:MAG: carbohydrate-binding protein, partial [Acidobacteria bacterium]|nr:carbohydrate-binding protein [Acidobacteriota bacterium]
MSIAASFTVDPRRGARNIFPRFEDNARVLRETYRAFAHDVRAGQFITPAAEWLLDNFHLMASEIRDVRENLPRNYYRELPRLASREYAGQARIYAMAVELLRHSDSRLTRQQLTVFVNSYQRVAPLTIGELWAWPSMLKLALIENLRRLADGIASARLERIAADLHVSQMERAEGDMARSLPAVLGPAYVVQLLHRLREYGPRLAGVRAAIDAHLAAENTSAEEAIRSEHQRQAATQASVSNAVNSLRLCGSLNWQDYFESVSLVEQVLQRDPAGAYGRMDFLSRDRQRQAVEQLAVPTGEAQVRVALRAVESARRAAASATTADGAFDRTTHVGYHLIDRGRPVLEADVAYRPKLRSRIHRFVFAHPTPIYLGAIGLMTAFLLFGASAYAHRAGAPPLLTMAMLLLLLIPAVDIAIALTQRVTAAMIPPLRLSRLSFKSGVPADARTMVVVPTLLTSIGAAERLVEHIEVLALGNMDPRIHFALLTDFTDANAKDL